MLRQHFWVRIQTSLKNTKGATSGQHTLARIKKPFRDGDPHYFQAFGHLKSCKALQIKVVTVILSVRVSAKFSTCSVVSVNGTLVEDKMRRIKEECAQFSFNKCPVYTHDGASAKFTNSHETDNSVHIVK
jgi:hypothetical protein